MEKKMPSRMVVIVIGGGKVGYYLAKTLTEHGHEARLIENDKIRSTHIANDLDFPIICGDGTRMDILESAGIREADAVVSVTGQDEINLVSCQLAKEVFGVKRTVARVSNPKNVAVMHRLGVDIPISTTDNIARLIEREVDLSGVKELLSINRGESSLSEFQLPQRYKHSGVRISEFKLPNESIIVSIVRDGAMIIPRGNTQLLSGDRIIAICQNTVLHAFSKVLGIEP